MMSKIIAILGILLGLFSFGLCGYLSYKNNTLGAEVARLREGLSNRDTLIAFQNAQIQKNALDIESYKALQQESDTKIITKFQNVYISDKTCKQELESIKRLVSTFYDTAP